MSFVIALVPAGLAFLGLALASVRLNKSVLRSEGLRLVHEDDRPEVDIVCVHGLGGNPVGTWTSRNNGEPVNWTKDYLPAHVGKRSGRRRRIRVLTYGYSPKLFAGSQGGLFSKSWDAEVLKYLPQALYLHSSRLIEQLAEVRVGDAEKRPVIFIAHSLGGLIVKSALVRASTAVDNDDARLKAIELLTIGVLFFGTPQREMRWKLWSDLLDRMFSVAKLTPLNAVLHPLAEQAELLNWQIERYKSIESNFFNFSFYEEEKSREIGSKIVNTDVVAPVAAKGHTWEKIGLHRSHKDLAKFDSEKEPDFLKVIDRIDKCIEPKNYQSALDRYSRFSSRKDSPTASNAGLIEAQQSAKESRAKMELDLAGVESSKSKENIEKRRQALRKKTKKKREGMKDTLKNYEQVNGLSDPATLTMVQKLASSAFDAGEYGEADALYKRLFVSTQANAPCSQEIANVLKDMAEVAERQGRLAEATKNLCRVREIQRIFGLKQNDPEILKVTRQIANLCNSRGLYDDALREYNEIITNLQTEPEPMDTPPTRVKTTIRHRRERSTPNALVENARERANDLLAQKLRDIEDPSSFENRTKV